MELFNFKKILEWRVKTAKWALCFLPLLLLIIIVCYVLDAYSQEKISPKTQSILITPNIKTISNSDPEYRINNSNPDVQLQNDIDAKL